MTLQDRLAAALRDKLPDVLSEYGIRLAGDPITFEGKASGIALALAEHLAKIPGLRIEADEAPDAIKALWPNRGCG